MTDAVYVADFADTILEAAVAGAPGGLAMTSTESPYDAGTYVVLRPRPANLLDKGVHRG